MFKNIIIKRIRIRIRNSPDSQKDDDDLVISYEFVLDMVEVEHSETERIEKINNQQLQTIKDNFLDLFFVCMCRMKYYT